MNRFKHISIVVLGVVLLLFSEDAFAQKYYDQSYRPAFHRTKSKDGFNVKGMNFGVGVLYYFGDADAGSGSLPVITSITFDDLGFAGFFNYNWPLTDHFGLQAGVDLGMLRGNNRKNAQASRREFMSAFLQPNVGVNIFPIDQMGLYFHFGIAATASYLLKFDYASVTDPALKPNFGILPMGQVQIGYNWNLTTAWRMGVFGAFKMGFMDMKNVNLDGWPVVPATANNWPDGYFQIGITINYYQRASLPFFKQ